MAVYTYVKVAHALGCQGVLDSLIALDEFLKVACDVAGARAFVGRCPDGLEPLGRCRRAARCRREQLLRARLLGQITRIGTFHRHLADRGRWLALSRRVGDGLSACIALWDRRGRLWARGRPVPERLVSWGNALDLLAFWKNRHRIDHEGTAGRCRWYWCRSGRKDGDLGSRLRR